MTRRKKTRTIEITEEVLLAPGFLLLTPYSSFQLPFLKMIVSVASFGML